MVKTWSLTVLFFATTATAAPLRLSQREVAELILKQGPAAQEVTYRYEQLRLPVFLANSILDWRVVVESGFQRTESESINLFNITGEEFRTTARLQKSLLTGTELSLNASRVSQKTDTPINNRPPQLTEDIVGLEIQQALWGNSFGWGDRARVRQAEYDYEASVGLRVNELEEVVLDGLRQFWNTYVAQENFRSAVAARDRYERLVTAVRRKNNLGYANPGEFSQVQAEYELQVQTVKRTSTEYLRALDGLVTSLGLPPGTEIEFSVSKEIPPLPSLPPREISDLRSVQSQELKVKAAQEAISLARSNEKPMVNLVARASAVGVDESASAAYAEMSSISQPTYYAGVRFSYNFGSGVLDEDIRAKRAALSLEETRLRLTQAREKDRHLDAERRVSAAYGIAESAQKAQQFRERAVNELNRTYNQGRTDIRILIENLNQLFNAEVQTIRALGEYQIALNEWAAFRDELIPNAPKEKQ